MENIENLIMSRTMYCEKCAKEQRPKLSNMVLLYRGEKKVYSCFSVKKDSAVSEYGFTPHLITKPEIFLDSEKKEFVLFEVYCGMNGCGIELKFKSNNTWEFYYIKSKLKVFSIKDFKELINYKDHEYYIFQ